jgi:hypothetical protein
MDEEVEGYTKKVYEPYREKDFTWRIPQSKYEVYKALETLVLSVS